LKPLFKPEEFENAGFSFSCGQKHIENGTLENDDLTISCDFPVGVFSNSNPK